MAVRNLYAYAVPYILIATFQYSFAKDGLRYSDPMTFMALRFLIASLATFTFARSFRPKFNKDTILLSLFSAMSTLLWIYGLQRVSTAQSAVLSFTMPLFAIPITALVLKERASPLAFLGTIVGFLGVVIYGLSLAGNGSTLLGGILTVGNAVFWALYTVYYRKTKNQDAMVTVGTQLLICGSLFAVFTPITFSVAVTSGLIVDIIYIATFSGFGSFLLWSAMLRRERVERVTTLALAIPAMTTLVQAVETGTAPGLVTLCGIGVIFLGIYISSIGAFTGSRFHDQEKVTG